MDKSQIKTQKFIIKYFTEIMIKEQLQKADDSSSL